MSATRLLDSIAGIALDLDGTLVDSAPDLGWAANQLLAAIGCDALPETALRSMIGNGIDAFLERVLAAALDELPPTRLLEQYRADFLECYRTHIFDHGSLFPGVLESLALLKAQGKRLACVTNKRSDLTTALLEASAIKPYFSLVLCADEPSQCKPAPAMLESLCRSWSLAPADILMIGDSNLDIATARAAGCPVAAVDYGYESLAILRQAAPDWIVHKLMEIESLILRSPGQHHCKQWSGGSDWC